MHQIKKKTKRIDRDTIEYEESEITREIGFPLDTENIEIK